MEAEKRYIAGYGINNRNPDRDQPGGHPGFRFNGATGDIVPEDEYQDFFSEPDNQVFRVNRQILEILEKSVKQREIKPLVEVSSSR